MVYGAPTDKSDLQRLKKEFDKFRDLYRFTSPYTNHSTESLTFGAASTQTPSISGLFALNPVVHTVSGTTLTLLSSSVIVDGTSPINVQTISGAVNGQLVLIKPKAGKTLVLKTGGNINIGTDVTINSGSEVLIQYQEDDSNKFNIVGSASGSGSSLWSGITIDVDKNMLGFGLSNLNYLAFDAGITRYIDGVSATGINYDVPTGETHRFKINAGLEYEFGSVNADWNGNNILNMGDIFFSISGQSILSDPLGLIHNVPTGDEHYFLINGSTKVEITPTDMILTSSTLAFNATNRIIYPSSGLRYDIPTGETHQFMINSSLIASITSGGLNMNTKTIFGIDDLTFAEAGQSINSTPSGFQYNVPAGDTYVWFANASQVMSLTSLQLNMSVPIAMANNNITGVNSISMNDANMLINDASNEFSFTVGSAQTLGFYCGATRFLSIGASTAILKSNGQIQLMVTGAGDTVIFSDGTGARLTYDWTSDDFYPVDQQSDLGRSGNRWNTVYAVNGTINTSFTRFKKDIVPVSTQECTDIVMSLPPIKYRMKTDKNMKWKDPTKKNRHESKVHFGFAADALETKMPEAVQNDGIYTNSVIAACLGAIQQLRAEVDELKKSKV